MNTRMSNCARGLIRGRADATLKHNERRVMAAQEQQIDYQNLLNKYHPRCPEGLLGVLVFEGKALTASSGSCRRLLMFSPQRSKDQRPPGK